MPATANDDLLRPLPGAPAAMDHLSLHAAEAAGMGRINALPRALKVMAEDILYRLPRDQACEQITALIARDPATPVSFAPSRALLQDFMGIPLMTDMASMRDALAARGLDPRLLDPAIPVDFVVDHSLSVLFAGNPDALAMNRKLELERNHERFAFIKWCQGAFGRFRVIPPGRGIMHQVNLEWLSHVIRLTDGADRPLARPDTMIGTDSHTTMVNALGILGWGVGGIEAEMAMLGTPLEMAPPRVVGIRLDGALREGVTATDLVLHVAEFLRGIGVVGAFVEFHGEGVAHLPLADRATIANMSPEYGATCTYFPIDPLTIAYLRMTGRSEDHLARIEAGARAQGLWQDPDAADSAALEFDAEHEFDLAGVEPCMAGPIRPDQRVPLAQVPGNFRTRLDDLAPGAEPGAGAGAALDHGAVVIAAITSCTNTSNPEVMMAAGLLARNARARGLKPRPWVKTSLSPGSRVVTDYLTAAGLTEDLDALGFHNVGYGCATCNGNSGPLAEDIAARIDTEGLCAVGVLSGNRNFEGRIHPQIKAAYLASPPLVIAAALAGTVARDLEAEPLGTGTDGQPVFLRDIWPAHDEIAEHVARYVTADRFTASYGAGMETTSDWEALDAPEGERFPWDAQSLFIRPSPFPELGPALPRSGAITGMRPLLMLGDAITTDHISPNGAIRPDSPAGQYLTAQGADPKRLGNFGTRRGNPDICLRGMFDNPLLLNELAGGKRGNVAIHHTSGEEVTVFEAAMRQREAETPLIIIAGRGYGAGSSRDWAAKGLRLLGVRAVLAESFERIHRSNLIGMGVLPLTFPEGMTRADLALEPASEITLVLPEAGLGPYCEVTLSMASPEREIVTHAQIASDNEVQMLARGGILPSMMSGFTAEGR